MGVEQHGWRRRHQGGARQDEVRVRRRGAPAGLAAVYVATTKRPVSSLDVVTGSFLVTLS